MPHADDPPRLLDDPGDASGDLRLGLERFSRDLPSPERLARLAAALGVAPTPLQPPADGKPLAAKLAVGAGIVGIAALGLFSLTRERSTADGAGPFPKLTTPSASVATPIATGAPRGSEGPGRNAPGAERPAGSPTLSEASDASPDGGGREPARSEPVSERAATRRTGDSPSLPSGSSTPSGPSRGVPMAPRIEQPAPGASSSAPTASETELLRDARLVLERDPKQALALSEQHRRAYPNGGFSQERELIAVTALVKLGRTAEARSRAERFRQNYPRSLYSERLDRLVSP